jgi:hypothetical protein
MMWAIGVLVPGNGGDEWARDLHPEERRRKDDVLITATGYVLLTQRLPRLADEVEKIMAEGKKVRAANPDANTNAVAVAKGQTGPR